jgi:membrane-associated phospholipid phosphatase
MPQKPRIRPRPEVALAGAGVVASAAFAALTAKTLAPRTVFRDLRFRRAIPFYGRKAKKVAVPFGNLAKEFAVVPAAGAVAALLLKEGRKTGAAAVLAATSTGIAASHIFDVTLPQKTPPPGRRAPLDAHYPSGHALHSTTFLSIAAWVLGREGIAPPKTLAVGAGALAASFGIDRLMFDRHWPSDVAGGWLAALAIGAFTAALYEHLSSPKGSLDPQR